MAYHNGMAIFAASFDSPEGKLRAGSAFLQDIVRADIPEPSSVLLVLAMFVGSAVRISRNG
jgi:hypothetical protein